MPEELEVTTVNVAVREDGQVARKAVVGYRTADPDLFATQRTSGPGWVVTHGPTGKMVSPGQGFDTAREAVAAVNRLAREVMTGAEMTRRVNAGEPFTAEDELAMGMAMRRWATEEPMIATDGSVSYR